LSVFIKKSFCAFLFAITMYGNAKASYEDDDFWLLLDYQPLQNVLWFYGGADEDDGNYFGVAADLAIIDKLHFNFSASRQNYTVATEELIWGFSCTINRYFSWQVSKIFWGKKDSLEKNDVQVASRFFYKRFNTRLSYESGDVELFLRDSPLINRNSISSEHKAYELTVGYSWPVFFTQLSYKKHDYEKNLSLLSRRQRLLNSINPIGIQQATALADTESSILLGLQADTIAYDILFSQIKSAVTLDSTTYATLHILKAITRQLEMGVEVELPVDNAPFSAGLSLGLMW